MADDDKKTTTAESTEKKHESTEENSEPSAVARKNKEEPKTQVKVSKKLEDIIAEIEKLSVLELSELVHALEKKFGISTAVPVAAAAAAPPAGSAADEGVSEQTSFNVILTNGGTNKISVIKAVREIVPTLGLKEAKDLVDAAPKPVLEGANKDTANEAKSKLEAAGAKVELQ